MILKKMLDEYDEIRKKLNEVSDEVGGNSIVLKHRRRLDEIHNFFISLRFKGIEIDETTSS